MLSNQSLSHITQSREQSSCSINPDFSGTPLHYFARNVRYSVTARKGKSPKRGYRTQRPLNHPIPSYPDLTYPSISLIFRPSSIPPNQKARFSLTIPSPLCPHIISIPSSQPTSSHSPSHPNKHKPPPTTPNPPPAPQSQNTSAALQKPPAY